jgi:hypothetical protein
MQHDNAPSDQTGLLIGLTAIGRLFGRSRWTIRRWIEREAFPACKLPNGSWITDLVLIRAWIMARHAASLGINLDSE